MNKTSFSTSPSDDEKGVLLFWDGFGLQSPASGIYAHICELYTQFRRCGLPPQILIDPSWRVHLEKDFSPTDLIDVPGIQLKRLNENKLLWNMRTSKYLRTRLMNSLDRVIYHSFSNYNLPFRMPKMVKCFLTIHDLIPYEFPRDVGLLYVWQFKALLQNSLKKRPHLIFVSEATQRSFEKHIGLYTGQAEVIENGMTPPVSHNEGVQSRKSILVVGRDEGYKRLNFAVEIFEKLSADYKMTIVTDRQGAIRIKERMSMRPDIKERVQVQSEVSKSQMVELYLASSVYLHTSLSEGFGLPLLEAVVHRRPLVVLPNIGISNKISTKVAVFPKSVEDAHCWVDAIREAEDLGGNPEFANSCDKTLGSFQSWKDIAQRISRLYETTIS